MSDFDSFETTALDALLAGDHPVLEQLRRQRIASTVRDRETTDFGRFTDFWVDDGAAPIEVTDRFAIDDVYARIAGVEDEVALLLHVVRGRIKSLEAFMPRPGWPEAPAIEELWYVIPDRGEAGQLVRASARHPDFALRGLGPRDDDDN